MKNYGEPVEINYHLNWPNILNHHYIILIVGGSGSGKPNVLLNSIKHQQPDIDRIYLHVKDPFESKYQLHIDGREKVGIKNLKNPKAFIVYLQKIDDDYKNLEDCNPKKRRVLTVFDDMITYTESNEKLSPIVNELFLRGRKLNISLVFISQSYFKALNATHYFIIKINNKRKLGQIASNHSSEIDFKNFMKIYKEYTKEPYSFLVNDTTSSSDNPLRFRNNLL